MSTRDNREHVIPRLGAIAAASDRAGIPRAGQGAANADSACVRSLLSTGPKITVTSFRIVSARPAGNHGATVRFTVQADATVDGTSIPVLPQGPGSQQWLVTTEEAGHWYVDLASTSDFAFSGACD
jgi:hypothetical protein